MKTILTTLFLAVQLIATTVKLDNVGIFFIEDTLTDTLFAKEFTEFHNNYKGNKLRRELHKILRGSEYKKIGTGIQSIREYIKTTNATNKFKVETLDDPFVIGTYNLNDSIIRINALHTHQSHEFLLYVFFHELAHAVQHQIGMIDFGSYLTSDDVIVNELFADKMAVELLLKYCPWLSADDAMKMRQPYQMLTKYSYAKDVKTWTTAWTLTKAVHDNISKEFDERYWR